MYPVTQALQHTCFTSHASLVRSRRQSENVLQGCIETVVFSLVIEVYDVLDIPH